MPTYQYACTNPEGKHEFELVQSFTDAPASECPVCGSPVRKVYGSVGVVFKGSGFYRTDSRGRARTGPRRARRGDFVQLLEPSSESSSSSSSKDSPPPVVVRSSSHVLVVLLQRREQGRRLTPAADPAPGRPGPRPSSTGPGAVSTICRDRLGTGAAGGHAGRVLPPPPSPLPVTARPPHRRRPAGGRRARAGAAPAARPRRRPGRRRPGRSWPRPTCRPARCWPRRTCGSPSSRRRSRPAGSAAAAGPLVGRVLAGSVRAGEPLTDVRLVGAGLTALLPAGPGRRPRPAGRPGGGGLVHTGDRVDVLARRRGARAGQPRHRPARQRRASRGRHAAGGCRCWPPPATRTADQPRRRPDRDARTARWMGAMLKGFKDFLLRGNVVDLAVAVVIGAAFTAGRLAARVVPHRFADQRRRGHGGRRS